MRAVLLLVVVALMLAEAKPQIAEPNEAYFQFFGFIRKFGKTYTSVTEFQTRFRIFTSNLALVAELNTRDTATYGITEFMDMSPEEFRGKYLMNQLPSMDVSGGSPCEVKAGNVPATKNWVKEGKTTAVKDQEQCGSCWAFSVTENVESVWMIGGNKEAILSPQQVVDCDSKDYGCGGGWPYYALQYIVDAGGMDSEASYPYKAVNQQCAFKKTDVAAKISDWCYVTQSKDEEQMRKFVGTTAPPSVCVDASSWQFYTGGVLSTCSDSIDHCVQLVGYDHDATSGLDYWLLRNSWGTGWGESGFIKLARNQDTCAVAELVTSAVL